MCDVTSDAVLLQLRHYVGQPVMNPACGLHWCMLLNLLPVFEYHTPACCLPDCLHSFMPSCVHVRCPTSSHTPGVRVLGPLQLPGVYLPARLPDCLTAVCPACPCCRPARCACAGPAAPAAVLQPAAAARAGGGTRQQSHQCPTEEAGDGAAEASESPGDTW